MKTFKEFIAEALPTQGVTTQVVTPLAKMSQAKQHKPGVVTTKPPVSHAADDAQKARDKAEREREAAQNKREAEQRHNLSQAHKESK